ncbi:tripartite-type tricarboxylate transporter receptor subunit TctC [Enterovirga rhinocerotis]|uniref:Tripartite-type tricarboxylate transporter receptor subunit TctC n=1 Tax=Enterovirga rhinocerotis TaxID=1339210 RepID=A0A4R7CC92_9HYPH|nr:tripartite-type tricarboxylate transporter receptor subunit TctC [Enterovirga rhinocerotis]
MGTGLDRRQFGLSAAGAAIALAAGRDARAQAGPITRPVTLVVPFAAGGSTDVLSRIVARRLSEKTGLSVVVENVGGAGGTIGAGRVARAEPDGSTILMATVATHALNPLMAKERPYDPVADFAPVSLLATVPNVLLVNPKVPVKSVQELIALLKAEPGKYSYASSGVGTPLHLSGELFKVLTGVKMEHVPYRGGGPAMTDLIGGQVPIMFDVLSGAAGFVRNGSVRALAVTTRTRVGSFPDLPTIAESGVPDYETYTWNAVFGPAKLPQPIVEFLSRELQAVIAEPAIRERLSDLSAVPVGSDPAGLAAQVKSELEKWAPVIAAAGLKQT